MKRVSRGPPQYLFCSGQVEGTQLSSRPRERESPTHTCVWICVYVTHTRRGIRRRAVISPKLSGGRFANFGAGIPRVTDTKERKKPKLDSPVIAANAYTAGQPFRENGAFIIIDDKRGQRISFSTATDRPSWLLIEFV